MIPTVLLTAYLLCASCHPVFLNTNIQDRGSVRKEEQFILDFNRINLNSISIKSEAELPDSLEESGWCLEIANIPEAELGIYGYVSDDFGFRGILIDMADELYHFPDIYFSSPHLQLPKAYWDEKEELLTLKVPVQIELSTHMRSLRLVIGNVVRRMPYEEKKIYITRNTR